MKNTEASPFVYLQLEVLNAFCILKKCASILIRMIETEIVEKILHSLMVKHSYGINKKNRISPSNYIVSKYIAIGLNIIKNINMFFE